MPKLPIFIKNLIYALVWKVRVSFRVIFDREMSWGWFHDSWIACLVTKMTIGFLGKATMISDYDHLCDSGDRIKLLMTCFWRFCPALMFRSVPKREVHNFESWRSHWTLSGVLMSAVFIKIITLKITAGISVQFRRITSIFNIVSWFDTSHFWPCLKSHSRKMIHGHLRKVLKNRLDKFWRMNRWNTLIEHKSSILELMISTLKNEYGQGPK